MASSEGGASALLSAYGHLEAIPEDPAKWTVRPRGADKLAATLREHRDEALLYRKLATVVTDAPLKETLAQLEWAGVPRAPFESLCDRLGLTTLKSRPKRWA